MMTPPRFSLVVSTIGRERELGRFCASLNEQTYHNFELILVDQSEGDELAEIVRRFGDRFPVIHLRSERGLSRGRNLGMKAATGDLIGFPDDDCWYGKDLLERVAAAFDTFPAVDMVTGMARDESGAPMGRWDRRPGAITRANVWRRAISMTIFLRRHVTEAVGVFDERLGVGSSTPFSSGEETDLIIRSIDRGFFGVYDPTLWVCHPNKKYLPAGINRSFNYGAGMGFVLAKSHYGLRTVALALARPLVGAIIFLAAGKTDRVRYQLRTANGRWWGYMEAHRLARCHPQLGDGRQSVGSASRSDAEPERPTPPPFQSLAASPNAKDSFVKLVGEQR
jgi:glycosyltransferase involved in cell wall biosynthesis